MALSPQQRAFVEASRTAVLATITADGAPRLVPICFVVDEDATLWSPLDEKPKRAADPRDLARVRDILVRPRVTLIVDRWDEDWSRLAWVRLEGEATLVEPGDAPMAIVEALRAKYPQYEDHDLSRRPAIRVAIRRATSWGAMQA